MKRNINKKRLRAEMNGDDDEEIGNFELAIMSMKTVPKKK